MELARLTYQKSRLVRSWTHLERQRGGFGFLGGPGETQIEADRRAIGERIDTIKGELGVVERTRRLHRKRRKQTQQQIVSLVGYTNAGKSSLFNALSGAGVLAQDMLFATLDPTLRRVKFPEGGAFILSDTVGFVSELPTQLIAAFHSTLEETLEADLILHVRDIASQASEAQRTEVREGLERDRHRRSRAGKPRDRGLEQGGPPAAGRARAAGQTGGAGQAFGGARIRRDRGGPCRACRARSASACKSRPARAPLSWATATARSSIGFTRTPKSSAAATITTAASISRCASPRSGKATSTGICAGRRH